MSFFINRVRFFTTSTGTGDLLVGSAYNGTFFTPDEAGATNGQPYTWVITRDNDVEITVANYSTAGGGTIVRSAGTTLISRIGGTVGTAKIDLPAGTTEVHIDAAAEDLLSMTTTRTANTFLAGPSTGSPAVPTFRAFVQADAPGGYMDLTNTQTVAGVKTFSSIPVLPASNPTTANQAARKDYVDTKQPIPSSNATIGVGTVVLAGREAGSSIAPGGTIAGSSLWVGWLSNSSKISGGTLPGTWANLLAVNSTQYTFSLWVRTA